MRKLLNGDRPLVGTYTLSGSDAVLETAARCGFDYVIVDCEHSSTSPFGSTLTNLIRAIEVGGAAPLVRIMAADPTQVLRAVDAGARGVIIPHVRSAEQIRAAVAAGTWPPAGSRGSAPMVRSANYGTRPWGDVVAAEQPIVGPLIEDPDGIANIDEILSVPNVAAMWFGAFDLAVAMGRPHPGMHDEVIEECRSKVYAAAAEHGIAVFDHTWNAEEAARLIALGAAGVSVSTDLTLLADHLRSLRAEIAVQLDAVRPIDGSDRHVRS